jgi:hypothetical protein
MGFNIFPHPTLEHFDPKKGIVPIITSKGEIEHLKITHPWTHSKDYTVAAGLIEILDQKNEKVEAFSFGGSLWIRSTEEKTSCLVTSPAPVLHFIPDGMTQIEEQFAEEVENLLAIRKAAYLDKKLDFGKKLATIPPQKLYISILVSIIAKYAHLSKLDSPPLSEFSQALQCIVENQFQKHNELRKVPPIQELL